MIQAKLFIMDQEIELLWTDMRYARGLRSNGKPGTRVNGGKISLCFETREDTPELLRWMARDSGDDGGQELNKMEEGKICFYEDGYDYPPIKTYEFSDAYLTYYKEFSSEESGVPLQTTMTISPAIQSYGGVKHVEPWNVSYVPPSEAEPYKAPPAEANTLPKFYDSYFEDMDGSIVKELKIGSEVYLVIVGENVSGKAVNVNLSDKKHDFIHNGEVLENDILKDLTLSGDTHKEKLMVIAQHHE